jgi:hypothetical protein
LFKRPTRPGGLLTCYRKTFGEEKAREERARSLFFTFINVIRVALSSSPETRIKLIDDLTRSDDSDALVSPDRKQVLAISGHDQLGARRDCRCDHMVVIGIVYHDTLHAGRQHQRHRAVCCPTSASMLVPND